MTSSTEYHGGPMANGTLHAVCGPNCNCSMMKNPGNIHPMYSMPPQSIYASTLPHRPVSGMRGSNDTLRPVYATLGSSHISPYPPGPPSSYFMMPPQEEKMYR